MDVEPTIEYLQSQIKEYRERIKWLKKNKAKLEMLPRCSSLGTDKIDFDFLSHADTIKVIRTLGGKWKKTQNEIAVAPNREKGQSIDYEAVIDGVPVRVWAGEPPPSCRIVEVEEVVPAHDIPAQHIPEKRVKVKKMICTGKDEPLLVSMSRVLKPNGE